MICLVSLTSRPLKAEFIPLVLETHRPSTDSSEAEFIPLLFETHRPSTDSLVV
jgi:hypothetical protein